MKELTKRVEAIGAGVTELWAIVSDNRDQLIDLRKLLVELGERLDGLGNGVHQCPSLQASGLRFMYHDDKGTKRYFMGPQWFLEMMRDGEWDIAYEPVRRCPYCEWEAE